MNLKKTMLYSFTLLVTANSNLYAVKKTLSLPDYGKVSLNKAKKPNKTKPITPSTGWKPTQKQLDYADKMFGVTTQQSNFFVFMDNHKQAQGIIAQMCPDKGPDAQTYNNLKAYRKLCAISLNWFSKKIGEEFCKSFTENQAMNKYYQGFCKIVSPLQNNLQK